MRFNFFSALLMMLIFASVGKVLYLFDRIMVSTTNIKTNAHTIFKLESANAANSEDTKPVEGSKAEVTKDSKGAADAGVDKIVSEAKTEKSKVVEKKKQILAPGITDVLETGFNGDEIRLLKELSKRREELDKYQQQLTTKESLLKSTEEKLERKLSELKQMEAKVEDLMQQLQSHGDSRIKSLAKIYESMKPGEAAKIFNDLEMPILIQVVRSMKEAKVAPIIAQMNPSKARDLSLEFTKINDSIDKIKE